MCIIRRRGVDYDKTIYYSAGSEKYLSNEISNHPERVLRLAKDMRIADKYLLFDFTDQDNIMGNDINKLDVNYEVGSDVDFKGLIYLQSFDLPKERDNSLINTAKTVLEDSASNNEHLKHGFLTKLDRHPRTIVLLTIWDDQEQLDNWLDSNHYASLDSFRSHSINNFHEFAKIID